MHTSVLSGIWDGHADPDPPAAQSYIRPLSPVEPADEQRKLPRWGDDVEKGKLTLSRNTNFVGNFQGFSLHYAYSSTGRYSERAMVYVFACSENGDGADFTPISALRRTSDVDRNDSEMHMELAMDARRRAKARIQNDSFETGRVYALEPDENGATCSFELVDGV